MIGAFFCPAAIVVSAPAKVDSAPVFATAGEWAAGGVRGHMQDSGSLWTLRSGATATWKPMFGGPVRARVAFYKVVYATDPKNNDPALKIEIAHAGSVTTQTINGTQGPSGWVDLGTFAWAGGPGEFVRLTKSNQGGAARVSAVRFDVLDESGKSVIGTFTLDEVTEGPLVAKPPLPTPSWSDVTAPDQRRALVALGDAATGISKTEFAPDRPARRSDLALWLLRATGRTATADSALSAARSAGLPLPATDAPLTGTEATTILRAAPAALLPGRAPSPASPAVSMGTNPLTRGQLAVAVAAFRDAQVVPGPPTASGRWKLTFQDGFDGTTLDRTVWDVESGAPGHIQSSRWPENVVVRGSLLQLLTRKEERGGKKWTTGNLWTRTFAQQYGYFECRMRIGAASGLNNAFWLMTPGKPTDPVHFEIDITEAHYPRSSQMTLHNWAGTHTGSGKLYSAPHDLSDDFHVYGLLWTEKELVWYFDGEEKRRMDAPFCRLPAPLRLSSAVAPFAGRITDALDGTHMDVDWVRVWSLQTPDATKQKEAAR